jgi:threonine/homoserine/homoserine lactone efflux protein
MTDLKVLSISLSVQNGVPYGFVIKTENWNLRNIAKNIKHKYFPILNSLQYIGIIMNDYSFLLTIGTVFMLGTMSPGPSFILIAKTAMGKSRKEGIGVAIGLGMGAVIFIIIAILGLYAILESVPFIYGFLKILGGMYLLYLAYKMWKYADEPLDTETSIDVKPKSFLKAILFGLVTQLCNPKTAIIIGSILAALLPAQIPAFGELFLCLVAFFADLIWYSLVVLLLSTNKAQKVYLQFKKYIDRVAGSVLGGLGLKLAADRA